MLNFKLYNVIKVLMPITLRTCIQGLQFFQ